MNLGVFEAEAGVGVAAGAVIMAAGTIHDRTGGRTHVRPLSERSCMLHYDKQVCGQRHCLDC